MQASMAAPTEPLTADEDELTAEDETALLHTWEEESDDEEPSLQKIKDFFKRAISTKGVIGLIKDKEITLKNIIVGFVAYGLERLTSSKVFHCPLQRHQAYGYCFLCVPAFLLFCANLLIIGEVWKVSGRCFIKRYQRRGDVIARLIPSVFVKAMVGPAAWLIACFVNGEYYICAVVGPGLDKRHLTDPAEIKALMKQFAVGKAQSLILAWLVFGLMTFLGTTVLIGKKCFLKDDLLLKNLYIFERREAAGAMFAFQKIVRGEDVDQLTEDEKKTKILNLGDGNKFKIYLEGLPEKEGKEKVKKIFKEANYDYSQAYEKFRKMYPRVTNGNPASPWLAIPIAEGACVGKSPWKSIASYHRLKNLE